MKRQFNRVMRLIIIGICTIAIVYFCRSIIGHWQRKEIVYKRENELKRVESEHAKLLEQQKEVQLPSFIEKQARDSLGLAREGESIVVLPDSSAFDLHTSRIAPDDPKKPNWKRWWELFF
jgi:hypothetical protein